MTATVQTLLEAPSGYASLPVARYLWQLDEQSRRLKDDTRSLAPDALEWQPAPGMNTIGMLLAHVAVSEAHLAAVGLEGLPTSEIVAVIGISMEDEGMPLPADGAPSAALAGRPIEFFHDLLDRARENTRAIARQLRDGDLERQVTRHRPDGTLRVFNVDWVLYHMLEHEAGHHGQILTLRHMHQAGFR